MAVKAYEILRPAHGAATSVIFASPHSGRSYPKSFLAASQLDEQLIRSSEDAFVDQLFASAPALGAPLLVAHAPRAYLDVNRAADELDPAVIDGIGRAQVNPRVNSGLGVIPRVVSNGRAIYSGKISRAEAELRLATVWQPYHAALGGLIRDNLARFGEAILVDCHSMPHEAVETFARSGGVRPHVVLGDRFGSSCSPAIIDLTEAAFERQGFRVSRNAPFSGAYVVQTYGRPARRQHVIQIEIDRGLYMNEAQIRPRSDFDAFRARLDNVIADIVTFGRAGAVPLAAE